MNRPTNQWGKGGVAPTQPLQIQPISYQLAQAVVVAEHYLHRRSSCSQAFGLYRSETLVGVAVFGSPVSSTLCRGICGPEEARNVIELTRLWCADTEPRNTESWFVSRVLRHLTKDIVVAFADPSVGHVGYVYQALNFIYTGLGPPRKRWRLVGTDSSHFHRAFTAGTTYAQAKLRTDIEYVPAVRKHRYIYFVRRREALRHALRYPILPYPKVVK